MEKETVKFVPNTEDDTHCFQAAFQIVVSTFDPEWKPTLEELEEITAYQPGKGTWPLTGILYLIKKGWSVKDIEVFDYRTFIDKPVDYLKEFYGPEASEYQIRGTNIEHETEQAKRLLQTNALEQRLPGISDIDRLLDEGFLIICLVNSSALRNKEGYTGHFVVVFDHDEHTFMMHDPGLPPIENKVIPKEQFLKGWESPSKMQRNIMAFRKP